MEIKAKNLSFEYDKGVRVLEDISFSVESGQTVGLVGANGAGKSTLLKLLVGLEEAPRGQLFAGALEVRKENLYEIRRRLGYVFQDAESQLFNLTGGAEVAFGPANYGYGEDEVERRVARALAMTGGEHLREKKIHKMSGGEKRLISIACVLSMEPELLLMDEPSIMLDPKNRRALIALLKKIDCTKLIATHDLDLVLDVCSHVMVMGAGRLTACGCAEDILSDRALMEANDLELPLRLQGR